MEFTAKYFSKEVFRNTFFCLLGYLALGSLIRFFGAGQYDPYSNTLIFLTIISGIANTLLLFGIVFFFYRDFVRKHQSIGLAELFTMGLIVYGSLMVITFIRMGIEDHFKFSSYFIDIFAETALYLLIALVIVSLICVNLIAMFKIYEKAGEKGWAAFVPFYNIIVMLKIVGRPSWWFVLFLIPFVNIIFAIVVAFDLSKKFGKYESFGFGLVLLPFIYYPILGFGDDEYGFD